jgi:hypothetical protein
MIVSTAKAGVDAADRLHIRRRAQDSVLTE